MNRLFLRIGPALPIFTALLLVMFTAACTATQTGDAPAPETDPIDSAGTEDLGAMDTDTDAMDTGAKTDADGPVEVRIKLTEYGIESPLDTFETGVTYKLILESNGALPHDFRITELGEAAAMVDMQTGSEPHTHGTELVMVPEADLAPGTTYETEVTFMQPGEFEMACHVLGHFEAGMWLPIQVVGETLAVPTPIDPESITYDAEAMAGMPCHAMGITIMGDCTEEDVERIKGEILAKSGAAMMSGAAGDHAHDEGDDHGGAGMTGDMGDMQGMDEMMEEMMGGKDRIIIDLSTRSDEVCQIVEENTIIGDCSNDDLIRLIEEIKASRAAAAESQDPMSGDEGMPAGDDAAEDHGHDDGDAEDGHEDDAGSDDSDG